MLQTLESAKPVLIHGFVLMAVLVFFQLLLEAFREAFLLYKPPIGFALLLLALFGIQPIILGVINILLIHRLYNSEGWQLGFWLNGLFLLLVFFAINLLLQTIWGLSFSLSIGLIEVLLLSYPFGYLGKFSNRAIPKS